MVSEVFQEKIKSIKRVLVDRCFFCENILEDGENKEVFTLRFCNVCYSKYELDKELNDKRETNGNGAKWRENVKTIRDLFGNRCFFCEKSLSKDIEQKESDIKGFLFPLCKTSCSQKYEMLENWRNVGLV